ncbi:porin PorA family protein [Tsukamurella sp. PLM1]|uniref:porin PorA family protein n=1 Tax=Tsukamurella sp. PLM1 TaxID=2929795 RepID=UPI00205F446E|nr:porin PorA family protein [Tsukamurella sp. PLM1]BDH55369.1 hypothetical protein MTP03_03080 [Tsukamurella sp. PLM1]
MRDFKLDVFDANQRWVDATVRSQAEAAKSAQNKLAITKYVVPVAGGVLGLIALGLGGFALLLGRRAAPAGGPSRDAGGRGGFGAPPAGPLDDEPTTPNATDDEPVTEAFGAQPRPDDSQTEAIDFRKPDQR